MSDKSKKFTPPVGFIVAVNAQQIAVARLAEALEIVDDYRVAVACEKAGYILVPDPMDIAADTAKVIALHKKRIDLAVALNEG